MARKVVDDDGHAPERGQRMAVCDKTYRLYQREPYPRQTKGTAYDVTMEAAQCRAPEGCC